MASRITFSVPRLILFDYGGVVADHYCQPFLNQLSTILGVDEQRVLAEVSENTEHGKNYRLNRVSLNEFWSIIKQRLGAVTFDSQVAQLLWAKTYVPNHAVLSLIQFLRDKYGTLTGLVLNEDVSRLKWVLEQPCNLPSYFDTIYASCQIGFLKPSNDFYQYVIDKNPWGLSANEMLVIDDRESHVQAPQKLGFTTYRYSTVGECNLYLTKLYHNEKAHNS